MGKDYIFVKGAKVHNLKNIDVRIPRNNLVAITGVSGSGKSSLAFDTIYAEGQRRYVESLSAYARQFLEQMERPDVEYIEGLSPAIAIDQKAVSKNPRSTVGTVTEIYDYLRLLFSNIGIPHCWVCGREISPQSPQEIVGQIMALGKDRILILSPVVRGKKGHYQTLFSDLQKEGFVRVRVDGSVFTLGKDEIELERYKKHTIEIVVDRITLGQESSQLRSRIADSVETALRYSEGLVGTVSTDSGKEQLFSTAMACSSCGVSLEKLTPRMFSFNSPYGACLTCDGLGVIMKVDPNLIIPDKTISVSEGAVLPLRNMNSYYYKMLRLVAEHYRFSLDIPFKDIPEECQKIVFYGSKDPIKFTIRSTYGTSEWSTYRPYEGIVNNLERRYRQTKSSYIRSEIQRYMANLPCPECGGHRLKPESLAVTIGDRNIARVSEMSIKDAYKFFSELRLTERESIIAKRILREIKARLEFLINVGLDYLTIDRSASTLAGGEAQRIRLATQVGSGLMGVIYILDEPSIGLHQRDIARLLATLKRLRDLGNTVIVVEHDESTIRSADYIIDMGPGAGDYGGRIVTAGKLDKIIRNGNSLTTKYLKEEIKIPVPPTRRKSKSHLTIKGAREHNLKNIDVKIPLGVLVCITGVSGSGKSTLINEILYRGLARIFYRSGLAPGVHDGLKGVENIDKVVIIDQSPIGRTPRSNLATYTGAWTPIRELFANTTEAKGRGYFPGRFSFNVRGGRCGACVGQGMIRIEMHFLPDIYVTCDVCKGKRFNQETLEVTYKGKNIAEVLDMSVDAAFGFFKNIPTVKRVLQTVRDVGLGYVKLGQTAPTLSGGEAQRIKLSRELSKRETGNTLYILDEPTTGLHFADIHRLLDVLSRLVDGGNTVLIIEHNMEVIKSADYIIDLGPEGGDEGGWVVAEGTPEEIAKRPDSYTGQYLRRILDAGTDRPN